MLIHVSGKGFQISPELRGDVEEKIGSALERFGQRIGRVRAYLADENGPKKGVDKSVRVIIDMKGLPAIVVQEKGSVWGAVLDRTVERAGYSLRRMIDRVRSKSNRISMGGSGANSPGLDLD